MNIHQVISKLVKLTEQNEIEWRSYVKHTYTASHNGCLFVVIHKKSSCRE